MLAESMVCQPVHLGLGSDGGDEAGEVLQALGRLVLDMREFENRRVFFFFFCFFFCFVGDDAESSSPELPSPSTPPFPLLDRVSGASIVVLSPPLLKLSVCVDAEESPATAAGGVSVRSLLHFCPSRNDCMASGSSSASASN